MDECFQKKTQEELNLDLNLFIEKHQVSILADITSENKIKQNISKNSERLIASFIKKVIENDPPVREILIEIVQGSMLQEFINFYGSINNSKKLDKLSLYLDTSLILSIIGGVVNITLEDCANELLQLLKKTGIKICCFENNIKEVQSILDELTFYINNPSSEPTSWRTCDSLDRLRKDNHAISDAFLKVKKISLNESLEKNNIKIVPLPAYDKYENVMDEHDFLSKLEKGYSNNPNIPVKKNIIKSDTNSISAIVRLRGGQTTQYFERNIAYFVTDNRKLDSFTRDYFKKEKDYNLYLDSPVIYFGNLTTILWMKDNKLTKEIPKNQLIATVNTILNVDQTTWSSFLNEARSMKGMSITEEDYAIIKTDSFCKELYQNLSVNSDSFNSATTLGKMQDILKEVERKRIQPFIDENEKLKKEATANSEEIQQIILENKRLREEIEENTKIQIIKKEKVLKLYTNLIHASILITDIIILSLSNLMLLNTKNLILIISINTLIVIMGMIIPSLSDEVKKNISKLANKIYDHIWRRGGDSNPRSRDCPLT